MCALLHYGRWTGTVLWLEWFLFFNSYCLGHPLPNQMKVCENVLSNLGVSCGHQALTICGFILSKRGWPTYLVSDSVISLLYLLERLIMVKVYVCYLYVCDRDAVHIQRRPRPLKGRICMCGGSGTDRGVLHFFF